jgi:hypothetical protein
MPVINGVYLKDFTALPGAVADADIIPIAITGDNVAYRTTVAGIVTDARITAKLLTGLSVTGGAVIAADTILEASVTLTNSAVIGKVLTGLNVTGGTVLAADSILDGFGKVQNQINGLIGGSIFQGTWNASTNTPTLVSSVGTNGYYYIVSVAGSTNLDGITDWKVGDWAIFAGAAWEKVDNTDSVSSVNGFTGAVSLTTDDISEGATNLYFTNTRARTAISLTTTGSSGASTYDSGTGVFNIPNYADAYVGTVTSVAAITLGTTGTDLSSTVANGTTTPVITLQVPTASATNRGALSSADWSTFNSKQSTITLTTTGTSGAATLVGSTLNVPNYADGGVLSLSAIGGTANANAATITGTVLNLQPASASFGGVVTTGTQTFAGSKTFNNDIYVIGGAEVYGLSAIGEYDGGAQIPPAYGGNYALTLGSGLTANGLSLYATGKGYFVGQLRLDSTITNGTYTYTLPSATGTLALTSALTGYLPLSGGTLTGALSGTSATFSGVITSTITADGILSALTASTSRKFITIGNNGVTLNLGIENSAGGDLATGTSAYASVIASVGVTRDLQLATNNTVRLTLASTGAATFSSSVQTSRLKLVESTYGTNYAIYTGVDNTNSIGIYNETSGVYNLKIASTGTATFINGASKLFEIASNTATGGYTRFTYNTSTSIGYIGSSSQLSGSGIVSDLELRADNNLFLTTTGGSLKLASTGAATFSSDIFARSGTIDSRAFKIYESSAGRGGLYPYNLVIGSGTDYSSVGIFSEAEIFFASGGITTKRLTIASTGAATFSSTIKTAAPSGGTAQPFKIGSVSAGDPTIVNELEVEINGVLYTIPCSIGTIP